MTIVAMTIVDKIQAIVASECASSSGEPLRWRIHDAISHLPDVDAPDHETSRWFEYDIAICDRGAADEEAELLAWLRSLDIAAAPDVAATFPLPGDDCVLVRRYWACPGERLLVPDPLTGGPWPEAERARFRRDMARLAEHGKVHPWARGFAHMYISDRTGTILLNSWPVLRSATPREQRDFLESIDFQLQRRT